MKRNKFNLSSSHLLSCDMGELVPIGLTEVLPGDTIQQATSMLIRVSPMLAPVMHPVTATIHHYFVPHRLTWSSWEDFITGGPDGNNASVFPTISLDQNHDAGSLGDYLGVPPIANGLTRAVSALPFRAYGLIWNEFFRDQDLQTERVVSLADGNDTTTAITLAKVNWEKDYFTSARPWAQKGTAVTIPIGGTAPIKSTGSQLVGYVTGSPDNPIPMRGVNGSPNLQFSAGPGATGTFHFGPDNTTIAALDADLTGATGITIQDLRERLSIQRFQELRAQYGSRFSEYLRYLGVIGGDARLQRPEYLGGGRQTIQFSEVLQTGVTTSGNAAGVGELRGHGIGALRSNRYRRYFTEHGYVVSLVFVRPKTMYVQGLARTWNRRTKYDFYQMEMAHIGQQPVLNKEVYIDHTTPDGTFGYQDRYDEYRRSESRVSGEFRSTLLDFWHMGRIFGSAPTLNSSFVQCDATKRIHATQTNDVLWIQAYHSMQARRIVPRNGLGIVK